MPRRCGGCAAPGPSPCAACAAGLRRASPAPPPPGLDECLALLAYQGAARSLVAGVKYRNERTAVRWLAAGLVGLVADAGLVGEVGVVTWVPTTPSRRRARGFDHAELLARRMGRHLDRPVRCLLGRREGPAQTGRSRAERWASPVVVARPVVARWPGALVLLVDDVITTGASMAAAARALRLGGVGPIVGVAAARTSGAMRR